MARRAEPLQTSKPLPRPERVAAFQRGLSAESRAALLLIAKGYRILARRWKTPFGEIDIVARRRRGLVFVEVKARGSVDEAVEAVTERTAGSSARLNCGSRAIPNMSTSKSVSTSSSLRRAKFHGTSSMLLVRRLGECLQRRSNAPIRRLRYRQRKWRACIKLFDAVMSCPQNPVHPLLNKLHPDQHRCP